MSTSVTCAPLTEREPIGLDELVARAALQTRVDRKYVLPVDEAWAVLALAEPEARVLEIDGIRSFGYESTYFDTPDLASYLSTARRRRRRFKVRTRTYLDSARCWLEVKTRGGRGSTVKNRMPYRLDQHADLAPGREFVADVLTRESIRLGADQRFAPVLVTRYRRSTLFLPSTASRVTVDTELTWEGVGPPLRLPELAVLETKTGSTASGVDRLLWARGHRPARISKYATGLAVLRPELPAAPWRRTLRRHFAPLISDGRHPTAMPPPVARHALVPGPTRPLAPETE